MQSKKKIEFSKIILVVVALATIAVLVVSFVLMCPSTLMQLNVRSATSFKAA